MDLTKVVLLYKMNAKGTHHIAYCEEYPSIQGIGPSQEQATANFWKAFNKAENQEDFQHHLDRVGEREEAEKTKKTNKKRAA